MQEVKEHRVFGRLLAHRVNKRYIGSHIIADFWNCSYEDDHKALLNLLTESAHVSNAKILSSLSHQFEPCGSTAILLLAESHISIHTWPEYNYIAIDVFTCGHDMKPEAAIKFLKEKLQPQQVTIKRIQRGRRKA